MRLKDERGNFYILAVMICTVLSILSYMLISSVSTEYLKCNQLAEKSAAFYLAEAGIEKAIWNLKQGNFNYKGEDSPLNNGRFSVKIEEKGDKFFITAIGYTNSRTKEKIKVIVKKENL